MICSQFTFCRSLADPNQHGWVRFMINELEWYQLEWDPMTSMLTAFRSHSLVCFLRWSPEDNHPIQQPFGNHFTSSRGYSQWWTSSGDGENYWLNTRLLQTRKKSLFGENQPAQPPCSRHGEDLHLFFKLPTSKNQFFLGWWVLIFRYFQIFSDIAVFPQVSIIYEISFSLPSKKWRTP